MYVAVATTTELDLVRIPLSALFASALTIGSLPIVASAVKESLVMRTKDRWSQMDRHGQRCRCVGRVPTPV